MKKKKIFCDFSIQRFQMMSFYLILFHFISKGLSPYHRNWYWSAFETEHVPNNWFNPIVYVRTFKWFDLSSIWFDRLLTCSFIWRVNLFTSMWEQQHRKNAHILEIYQKSLYSLTMEWNKTLPTLIKFNSQLDIYVKCTHRVNNRHGTARTRTRDKTFLMWNSFTQWWICARGADMKKLNLYAKGFAFFGPQIELRVAKVHRSSSDVIIRIFFATNVLRSSFS